jgi:hypothetical protein
MAALLFWPGYQSVSFYTPPPFSHLDNSGHHHHMMPAAASPLATRSGGSSSNDQNLPPFTTVHVDHCFHSTLQEERAS